MISSESNTECLQVFYTVQVMRASLGSKPCRDSLAFLTTSLIVSNYSGCNLSQYENFAEHYNMCNFKKNNKIGKQWGGLGTVIINKGKVKCRKCLDTSSSGKKTSNQLFVHAVKYHMTSNCLAYFYCWECFATVGMW